MKKWIKAFTIIELVVAMVLSGVTISAGIIIYMNFSKAYKDSINRNAYNHDILFLHQLLTDDFYNAKMINCSGLTIKIETIDNEELQYRFLSDMIIRSKKFQKDTFYVQTINHQHETVQQLFEKKRIAGKYNRLISEFSFEIVIEKDYVYPVVLYKQYDNYKYYEMTEKRE
jgi:hypothetical protein